METLVQRGPGKGLSYNCAIRTIGGEIFTQDLIDSVAAWSDCWLDRASAAGVNFNTIGLDKNLRYMATAWHGDCRDVLVVPVGSYGFGRYECSVIHYNANRDVYDARFPIALHDIVSARSCETDGDQ